MADTQYPPDLELEINVPIRLDFDWNPQYKKQPYEGKTKSGKNPGSPYWRYPVLVDGKKMQWTLWSGQAELKTAIEIIRQQGWERVAVMKMEEDKKHYYCLSNPGGGLMNCCPNHEVPQRFVDFVGIAPATGGAGGVVLPTPLPSAPPSSLPRKTMEECINEAWMAWCPVLRFAYAQRTASNEPDAEIRDAEYLALQQAMANGLAQTAHTLYIASQKNGY